MDFDDASDEAAFRADVRAWLAQNAEPKRHARDFIGDGLPPAERLAASRAWQANKAAAGYAAVTWPREFGGLGGTVVQQLIYRQEECRYRSSFGYFEIGLGMCLPTLLAYASSEHKARYVRPGLYGQEIWCQMFSEPGAGSDVAGLTTRAVRDGDEWVIDGQKVWTSAAHYAAFGMCVTRSDASLPKHQGLSMFIVPVDTAGIEVRPLVLMTGDHAFNEVFFTGVRIPAANIVGDLNGGWRCALSMLMNERVALGASGNSLVSGRADVLIHAARNAGVNHDLVLRQELADVYILEEVLRHVGLRVRAALESGRAPGPEGSIAKLIGSKLVTKAASVGMTIAGPRGAARMVDDEDSHNVTKGFLHAPSMSIAGGTSEIQRNIMGERVLGLPKDPDPFRSAAFADIPKN